MALIAFAIATRHIWDDKCYPYALERSLFDSPFYRSPWPLSSIMLQRKRADDAHFLFVREGDKPPANKYDVSGTNFKTPIGVIVLVVGILVSTPQFTQTHSVQHIGSTQGLYLSSTRNPQFHTKHPSVPPNPQFHNKISQINTKTPSVPHQKSISSTPLSSTPKPPQFYTKNLSVQHTPQFHTKKPSVPHQNPLSSTPKRPQFHTKNPSELESLLN